MAGLNKTTAPGGTGLTSPGDSRFRRCWPIVLFLALTALGVGSVSIYALLTVVIDVVTAGMILLPAALAGLWMVPVRRMGEVPRRWHSLLSACLGLGSFSLLILVMGLAGHLDRNLWDTLLIALAIMGVIKLRRGGVARNTAKQDDIACGTTGRGFSYVWVVAVPFLVLALLAAANAPGLIWSEEGYGYDVLGYHLQMPREYFDAGQITYAPHNVYANFPALVEMYYLLTMVVVDDVSDVGTKANMIHLVFALLTVWAAWVVGRDWSRAAGVVAGLAAASAGWLSYLSGLAYVENAMLFFGVVAVGCVLRSLRTEAGGRVWLILAGLAAGFACGCKYTAFVMIAAPLGVALFAASRQALRGRVASSLTFSLACLLACCPWLIKNMVMTGNPVFPLANSLFHAAPEGWGEAETERFDAGHRLVSAERPIGARLAASWGRTVGDPLQRFGPVVFLLAIGGLIGRKRDRTDVALVVVLVVQVLVWLFATHLYGRFAVVLLIPLVLLAGRSIAFDAPRPRRTIVAVALLAGCVWNFVFSVRLNAAESLNGAPASLIYKGELPSYDYMAAVNRELPEDAKILLVGEARALYFQRDVDYCVVFNRNPFIEVVRAAVSDEQIVTWLREQGYTHVLINWLEVSRLARTYGFAEEINPTLFTRLESAGLPRTHRFLVPEKTSLHVDIHEVR